MRNKVLWSLVSLTVLAASALAAGCDSDARVARSAEGESCTKTSDCDDGLHCKALVCVASGTDQNNGDGDGGGGESAGNSTAGTGPGVKPVPPVLGGLGESCTRRADCEDGLACISQRCQTSDSMGEGGGGNAGPALGRMGESCGLTSDCESGLSCLPTAGPYYPETTALGGAGVCLPTNNGLEPTGKTCNAECLSASDCCELPIELHASLVAESCAELETLLDGVNCETATAGTLNASRCFAQSTYCDCARNTWACSAGTCVFTASCSKAAFNSPEGCPTYTRSGKSLTATCDTTGSKKCQPAAMDGCKKSADCEGQYLAGSQTETCAAGECVCHKESGLCYRACSEDLDCPVRVGQGDAAGARYVCDTDTSLCVSGPSCSLDSECVVANNDASFKCFDGVCDRGCSNDRDCNNGVLTRGADTLVCNADGRCEKAGCISDSECAPAPSGVRMFCGETAAAAPTGVVSAITD